MTIKDVLFRLDDEVEFKRQFVIQFLASYQGANYHRDTIKGGPVRNARALADDAWTKWTKEIGVIGIGG